MSEPYTYKNKDRICEMCGDSLYDESDYCDTCKDHTTALIACDECGGTGEVEVIDYHSVRWWTISPPYRKEKCDKCNGEGYYER